MYSYLEYPEIPSINHTDDTLYVSHYIENATGVCPLIYKTDFWGSSLKVRIQNFQMSFSMEDLMDFGVMANEVDVNTLIAHTIVEEYNKHLEYDTSRKS